MYSAESTPAGPSATIRHGQSPGAALFQSPGAVPGEQSFLTYKTEMFPRRGFSRERIALVKQMHRLLYREGLTLEKSRDAMAGLLGTVEDGDGDVQAMLDFLAASTRGIAR